MRRSRVILLIVITAIMACALGLYAKVTLSYWGLFTHALLTIAVIGGFMLYLLLSIMFSPNPNHSTTTISSPKHPSITTEPLKLLIPLLPLLFIFALGIYSLCLLLMVDEELEERKKTH